MEAADSAGPELSAKARRQRGRSAPVDSQNGTVSGNTTAEDSGRQYQNESDDESEEEEEEDEPRLKYGSLTKSVGALYRNGDATSTFLLSGDKMVFRPDHSVEEFSGRITEL